MIGPQPPPVCACCTHRQPGAGRFVFNDFGPAGRLLLQNTAQGNTHPTIQLTLAVYLSLLGSCVIDLSPGLMKIEILDGRFQF